MNRSFVFIDFDGTVVDVWKRYYGIFSSYIEKLDMDSVSIESFIAKKRKGLKEHEIVNPKDLVDFNIGDYVLHKQERLESVDWLKEDNVIEGVRESISELKTLRFQCVLVTQRRVKENLFKQLCDLNLINVFDEIIVVTPLPTGNAKIEALSAKTIEGGYFIGDSRIDKECAEFYGLPYFHVDTGLSDIECENKYSNLPFAIDAIIKKERK